MKGTWQTDDHGGRGLAVLVIIAAFILGSSGAVAVAATAIIAVLAIAVFLAAAGLAVLVIWRLRSGPPYSAVLAERAAAVRAEQATQGAGKAALRGGNAPRELHQHVHLHGLEPEQYAEILRRHQAE